MKYSNSDIGKLQEQKTGIEQTNSFNAIETQLDKVDVLETRYFGNNTISGVEGKPVISEAVTADPESIIGEVIPSGIISLETVNTNINTWINPTVSNGVMSTTLSCSEVSLSDWDNTPFFNEYISDSNKWWCNSVSDYSSAGSGLFFFDEGLSPLTFFVTVLGRSLDSLPSAGDPKRADYIGFGLGNKITIKIPNATIKNKHKLVIPTFPVYTKTRVDTYIYSTAESSGIENKLKRTMPFVSTTFPVLTFVTDNKNDLLNFSNDGSNTGKIFFKNSLLNDNLFSEAVAHRPLIRTDEALTDDIIADVTPALAFLNRTGNIIDNLFNKVGSINYYNKDNAKTIYTDEEIFMLDGLHLEGRIYPSVNVLEYTGTGVSTDIEIDYIVSEVNKSSNTNKDITTDYLWYAGEAVYTLVPTDLRVGGTTVSKKQVDLFYHDPDRIDIMSGVHNTGKVASLSSIEAYNTLYTSSDRKIKIIAYAINYVDNNEVSRKKIVFGLYDKDTEYIYTPSYYGSHDITDYRSLLVDSISLVTDKADEKVCLIEYHCDGTAYKCSLSCIKTSNFSTISSVVNYTNLQDMWTVTCDYIDNDFSLIKDSECVTTRPSNGYANSRYLSVIGGDNGEDTYSLPLTNFLIFAYQNITLSGDGGLFFNQAWGKAIRKEDYPFILPPSTVKSSSIFVYGNSCFAWKSPVVNIEHTCGLHYELFLASYRNNGHAEHMYTVPLYTEAYSLPILFPLLMPMKNVAENTLVKHCSNDIQNYHNNHKHTVFRRIDGPYPHSSLAKYWKMFYASHDVIHFPFNQTTTAYDYTSLNVHLISTYDEGEESRASFMNKYNNGIKYSYDENGTPTEFNLSSVYKAGHVGTIMVYPTKRLSSTGTFTNLDTVAQYNNLSFFNKQIVHGLGTSVIDSVFYTIKDDKFYKASSMYKLTSTIDQTSEVGLLSGGGSVKTYTVGAYVFIVKGSNSEVYFQSEQGLVPVFADSGVIVDSPVVSGMEVYFAVQTANTIKVYSISKLDVTSRNTITASGLKNVVTFWSSKLVRPCIAYNTDEDLEKCNLHFKAIYQAGVVTACSSIQYTTSLLIQRNKINGISQPPVFIKDGISYNVVSSANAANSMSITSSDIDMPEYKGMMFILTGIEVDLVRYGSTQSTVSVSLYNSFDRTSLGTTTFSANDISLLHGRIKYNLTPNINIRRVYYSISSSGYKITGVRLTGYFTELV